VTRAAGITNVHHKPILDHQLDNIMSWVSSVGAAASAGDFNNDGWLDLYVTDSDKGWPNHLYRNNKDGTFTDVAVQAGVADLNNDGGVSMDCVWGDYDNDGWPDLYVVRWGYDVLFHNNRDGTFTDVTKKLFRRRDGSPGTDWANGCAAIWLDFNLDGRLDLYVGNYFDEFDLWHLKTTRIMHDDFEKARNAGHNFLYRQNADGTFTEVGAAAGGVDDPGWTLGVGAGDLNNDGWPDLYCADDFGPDQLYLNNHNGTFTNVTAIAIGFDTKKGMNVEMGDVDNDGWLDIYVANITTAEYLQEGNMLWHNNGPGPDGGVTFTDISLETGTYDGGWGWGAKFFDYDNDGDLDIIAVNGFISAGAGNYWYDLASWSVKGQDVSDAKNWPTIGDRSFSGYERTRVWRNDGRYMFSERARELGLDSDRDGRGVVCFDFDNDGDLDVFVANQDQPPQLYRNNLSRSNHWLTVRLEGAATPGNNRDAIGARVTAITANSRQFRERDGGNGYAGQSDPRLHFGLGADALIKLLEVRWPDGGLQYLENIPADQILTIRQDSKNYASQITPTQPPPKPWQRAKGRDQRVVPKMSADDLHRLLSEMETKLRGSLDTYKLASTYRARCADYDQHDRAIKFFSELVAAQTNNLRARLELGCAFVDKIPTCGGMAAIVSKGTLARKALDQMDAVVKAQPDLWVAYYVRGINHLYWPRALRHSKNAITDLTRCIELQERSRNGPLPPRPPSPVGRVTPGEGGLGGEGHNDWAGKPKSYYVRSYIALGDACTKDGQPDKARRAWRQGLKLFPDATELKTRLAIADNAALLKFVESQRTLDQPIDTDLTFLDRAP